MSEIDKLAKVLSVTNDDTELADPFRFLSKDIIAAVWLSLMAHLKRLLRNETCQQVQSERVR